MWRGCPGPGARRGGWICAPLGLWGGLSSANAQLQEVSLIRTDTRTNEEIRAVEILLIDEAGKSLGIVPREKALERAQSKVLDLVEVAPDGEPPVCRIMDFKKYIYEQKRKQKLAKKKTSKVETKEIKLRPNIGPHDLGIKLDRARGFLEKGDKVKVTLRYRPREMRHYEIGTHVLDRIVENLKDISLVESSSTGNRHVRLQTILIAPRKEAIKRMQESLGAQDGEQVE